MTENHSNQNNHYHNNKKHQREPRSNNTLYPARILEQYENIESGSANRLLDLAKKEQDHRHSWQDRYLKFHNFSYKAGLVCGFIYNIALLALIYKLIEGDKPKLALKLFVVNAILIAFALIVTYVERKITTRKPPRRNFGGGQVKGNKNNNRGPRKQQSPR